MKFLAVIFAFVVFHVLCSAAKLKPKTTEEVLRELHNLKADKGEPEDPKVEEVENTGSEPVSIAETHPSCAAVLQAHILNIIPTLKKKRRKGLITNAEEKLLQRMKRFVAWDDTVSAATGTGGGAIYTRWGRRSCPSTDTELVYNGVAAGGHYTHQGSGSDLICITRAPEYHNYTSGQEKHALIYGAEYEAPKAYFSYANAPTNNDNALQDHDVPCAVCRANTRSSALMIGGRKTCHGEGWTREYWGYLATGHYNHKGQIQHVCVDRAPQGDFSGSANNNGALLYVVQGVCGSLPCPPYVNNWELTCVVCTK